MRLSRRKVLLGLGGGAGGSAVGLFTYGQVAAPRGEQPPSALVAGSLLRVAQAIPEAQIEAHGSAVIRQLLLTDQRNPDAVALADPRLFAEIADRVTLFATNALVLTYNPDSPHASVLTHHWQRALSRSDLQLGRTDPDADPLGYRTVMALRLAARAYDIDATAVLNRAQVFPEVDLLNVLEQGGLDAAFTYRNMAVERDLPYVDLPARIDFSDPAYADHYATVSYALPNTTVQGRPIRYGATALTSLGEAWVHRLSTAHHTLRTNGFTVPAGYPDRDFRIATANRR